MGKIDKSEAFIRAFESSDCETLNKHIQEWFVKAYRTPENSIDVVACVQSAMIEALTAKIIECETSWRDAEAARWRQARQNFDAGMRGFLEGVGMSPKPEPYAGEQKEQSASKPSIGSGWHVPQIAQRRRGRPPKSTLPPLHVASNGWGSTTRA